MKPSWSFILSSLYCSRVAASIPAHVFLFDPAGSASPPTQVTPETARLILAQRLGVSQFHSIENPNEELIQQLNAYGGGQSRLLSAGTSRTSKSDSSVLIWLEDVENIEAIIPHAQSYTGSFTIKSPPTQPDNERLLHHIKMQADSLPKKSDPLATTHSTNIDIKVALKTVKTVDVHNEYLSILHADKKDKLSHAELVKALGNLIDLSKKNGEAGWPITVVLMPPSSSKKNTKRAAHPYGTYSLPALSGRQAEAPLFSTPPKQPSISETEVSAAEKSPSNSSRVLGILPVCFASLSQCESRTHKCSGHGKCVRRKQASSDKGDPCFSCVCSPTKQTIEHGGMEESFKTTYWGGPACQKKDVSVPFFLFAGTGVVLAFLIAGGIGLMYSMGSEELPSVIGAGVSGPVRK